MAELLHGHLFRLTFTCVVLYAVLQVVLPVQQLILIENGLLLSVSAGVMIAYTPIAWAALRAAVPTRGHWLGLGIWLSWASSFAVRIMSIVMRNFGYTDIINTHWRTVAVAPLLLGGILHLWAPLSEDETLRARRWIFPGIVGASGIFTVWLLWVLPQAHR